ncbi:polysaccharide biosynthesis tyrosine autokinase [Geodermatophilus sp. SYSU D00691]
MKDYIRILREQWLLIVLAVALGVGAAAAIWVSTPKQYTAFLTMYVSAQSGGTADSAYNAGLLSEQRVASYVELTGSERVAEAVVERLELDESPSALAQRISASASPETVLIYVAVSGEAPEEVASIANAVGDVVPDLVDELEAPTTDTGTPPVAVRVVEPAAVPSAPSSTGLSTTLIFGLIAGLVVGTAGAFARNALDTSVKTPERLRVITGAPNLGSVAFSPQVPQRPLTVHEDAQSPRSEAFRQLRTNLHFVDVEAPRRVILVSSSVAGEGKTTTVANLALAVAATGTRVVVVDADLRRPRIAKLLGLEGSVGLTSVLVNRISVDQALQPGAGGSFDVLTSGPLPPNPSELLASKAMELVIASLRERYDMVLIDAPPLLPVTDAAALAPSTDGVLLVCRYQRTTAAQLRAAVEALQAVSSAPLGTIFNMVPRRGPHAYAQYHTYYRRLEGSAPMIVEAGGHAASRSPIVSGMAPESSSEQASVSPRP